MLALLFIFLFTYVFLSSVITAANRYGSGAAGGVAVVWGVISICVMTPLAIVPCLVAFLLSIAYPKPKVIIAGAIASTVASYVFGLCFVLREYGEIKDLQRQHAVVSLQDRLGHEHGDLSDALPNHESRLSSRVANRLVSFEQDRVGRTYRGYRLMILHRRNELDFILANGFGVSRMIDVRPEAVAIPKGQSIPLPEPIKEYAPSGTEPNVDARACVHRSAGIGTD